MFHPSTYHPVPSYIHPSGRHLWKQEDYEEGYYGRNPRLIQEYAKIRVERFWEWVTAMDEKIKGYSDRHYSFFWVDEPVYK